MKRRLSITLSTLGNPKIILLDEPTTGMDVKNRRDVWDLIQNIKQRDVSIIMTTHAMEEAEYLSDRIMVLNEGEMKAIGTGLYLKNQFGNGYKLKLIVNPKKSEETYHLIKKMIPSSKLLSSSGGSMIFTILLDNLKEL